MEEAAQKEISLDARCICGHRYFMHIYSDGRQSSGCTQPDCSCLKWHYGPEMSAEWLEGYRAGLNAHHGFAHYGLRGSSDA